MSKTILIFNNILSNGNITTGFNLISKTPKKLLNDLSVIKKVNLIDLHNFLAQDHTNFSVLSVSCKHIESTNRISVSLTKNSANSFYLDQKKESKSTDFNTLTKPKIKDDCLADAENCAYFAFFNSKEKKLYTRFKDKVEANFEGTEGNQPVLFLTLTFNTTHTNYSAFTTNWNPSDSCWEPISQKNNWLKNWAQNTFQDDQAEKLKTLIQKVPQNLASDFTQASKYLSKLLRDIRLKWKPSNWKWTVVAELQKAKDNRPPTWHFHLLSTPIVPYSHKCTLDKDFTSCWNCRAYISELWPYGRVESRTPSYKTISNYLAKYLSKSFHLRTLYAQYGFQTNNKAYRFFKNLYQYEQRTAIIQNGKKLDALSGEFLPRNQKIFHSYNYNTAETSYFYRTNEKLVGKSAKPILIKKNYRLGTRSLNSLNLVSLASKDKKKEAILLTKKEKLKSLKISDFQEFITIRCFLFCKTAEFVHIPVEREEVPKELNSCDNTIQNHLQTKPVLRFTFEPQQAPVIRQLIEKLDDYAKEYDMEEAQDFTAYPTSHDAKHETIQQLGGLCGCETSARNTYLNNWFWDYVHYNTDRKTPIF